MAGLTGLFQRGNSYYIQVVLPAEHPLHGSYKNGKFVASLGPCSYREALRKGTIKRTQVLYGADERVQAHDPDTKMIVGLSDRHGLRDIHAKWKSSRSRSVDAVDSCLRAVRLYEEFTGNLPIEELNREMGEAFRRWLEHTDRKTTSKTARDRLTWVKCLLDFSANDLGLLSKSPWTGIDIEFRTTHKRRPWTDEELSLLFSQPLHTEYWLPIEKKAGRDAAYWIPLLGLFTGARVGELAQLQVSDVRIDRPVPVISITNEGDAQRVKTKAGLRDVPIHSELIRLGFLNFVASVNVSSHKALWPDLPKRLGKPGGYFSQWFGSYRELLGFGKAPDFHCFRHTVRTQMAELGIQEPVIDMLLGHEITGSVGAKVYTHRGIKTLSDAIEGLHYPVIAQTLSPVWAPQRLTRVDDLRMGRKSHRHPLRSP